MSEKVAFITGAAKGIGLAIARVLYRDGLSVALADRDGDGVNAAAASFPDGERVYPVVMDVGETARAIETLTAFAQHIGRLDCLVNNAGIFRNEPFLDVTEETYDRIMNVNLKSTFFLTQAAGREMKRFGNGGVIVNIASAAGRSGRPTQAVYGLSKAGMIHLAKSAALALAPDIRVLAVCPAAIESDMWQETLAQRRAVGGDEDVQKLLARIPLSRAGTPEEVAELVAFLVSDRAAFTTGTTLDISGGMEM